jgi:hypothetical protein
LSAADAIMVLMADQNIFSVLAHAQAKKWIRLHQGAASPTVIYYGVGGAQFITNANVLGVVDTMRRRKAFEEENSNG